MIKLEIVSAEARRLLSEVEIQNSNLKRKFDNLEKEKLKEKYITIIFNYAKEKIMRNHISYSSRFTITTEGHNKMFELFSLSEISEIIEKAMLLIQKAGYIVKIYEYSRGWYNKSGKFCEITIEWK